MTGKTFGGTYSSGITLSNVSYNPATVAGSIDTAVGTALYGAAGTAWMITNQGIIKSTDTSFSGRGISLASGGVITNLSGATITGADGISGTGGVMSVVNAGSISGHGAYGVGGFTGYYVGIYLEAGGSVTNQRGGRISGAGGIEGDNDAITVVNDGSIAANPAYGSGIILSAGGAVTNQTGAVVTGIDGVLGFGTAVSVLNAGTIAALYSTLSGPFHLGTEADALGIELDNGGWVSNASTGTIQSGIGGGVAIKSGAGTVLNSGMILASSSGALDAAVYLSAGGYVSNSGAGTISAPLRQGVYIKGAAGTVVNSGLIMTSGVTQRAVLMLVGGYVNNAGTGAIDAAAGTGVYIMGAIGTVMNAGSIEGSSQTISGRGIALHAGGSVTNQSSASITAYDGISAGAIATVVNAGGIVGSRTAASGTGILLNASGSVTNHGGGMIGGFRGIFATVVAATVVNYGTIAGGSGTVLVNNTLAMGRGIGLSAGGVVVNQTSANVNGYMGISAGGELTVTNSGSIAGDAAGTSGKGVYFHAAGEVTNQFSGTISGFAGIYGGKFGALTVTNAGAINGTKDAVELIGGAPDRVIAEPGGQFAGTVDGGNTIGATAVSTLELASGASTGTLSGIGTQFIGFAQTTIDTNAAWTLTGANTLVAGATLTNAGTLTLLDSAFTGAGSVINNGSIIVDPSTLTLAALGGTGEVVIDSGSTVVAQGSVGVGETLAFSHGGGVLDVTASAFSGTIAGFDASDTIDLTGVTDATSAGIVNGDTLQIQQSSGPAILLTLEPDQDYGVGQFTAGADGALTSNLDRTLSWTGEVGNTTFNVAANWDDVTDNQNSAQTPPDATDTIVFDTDGGGAISGSDTVAAVDVGSNGDGVLQLGDGATLVTGSLDAGVTATDVAQIGVVGPGTELSVTGAATVADDGTGVLSVLSGATFVAGNLTIGSQSDSSGAVVVSGASSVLDLSGALNIGTANGTGDLTVGPGAAINAQAVIQQGQVVLEGGLLDPTVQLINQGQTAGGFGTIAAGDIVDEGAIQAGGNKGSQKLLIVQGTVLGGGTLTVDGTLPGSVPAGIMQINAGGTLELSGAVLNAATTTFTDNLTPTGTYTVNNSVIDVNFVDPAGVLLLADIAGFGGTITAWQAGDSFVIIGGTLSGLGVSNNNTLTVADSGSHAAAGGIDQIIFGSAVSAAGFKIDNSNTIQAQAPCFAAGTLIDTENGAVPVETLTAGDIVRTVLGGPVRIVWVGARSVDCTRHPRPETVWPIRISRGAIAENLPARDLFVSPDHAIYLDGVLIPAKHLVNGTTIRQVERSRVSYHHIELSRHDVVLAEGLPAESYLDTGDRARFSGGPVVALHPDFSPRMWESLGCAPLVVTGPSLAAVRRLVNARAIVGTIAAIRA